MTRYTAACGVCSAALYSIFTPLSEQTGLSLDQLNQGTGYQYFTIGIGSLIAQPAALAFGKKPVYILSSLFTVPVVIWTLYTHGNSQWVANRLIFGIVSSACFTLPEASLSDIYFYHERAWPMGCYVAVIYAGALVGPIMGGCVFVTNGWKPVLYIAAAIQAAATVYLILFLEETNYDRSHLPATSTIEVSTTPTSSGPQGGEAETKEKDGEVVGIREAEVEIPVLEHHRIATPWHGLRPFAFKKPSPYWAGIMIRGFIQPFLLLPIPLVLWSGLMYGLYQGLFNRESWLRYLNQAKIVNVSHQLSYFRHPCRAPVQLQHQECWLDFHFALDCHYTRVSWLYRGRSAVD